MASSRNSILLQLKYIIWLPIYFTIQILNKFQLSCSKLLSHMFLWLNGCTQDGKTLADIPGPIPLPFFGTSFNSEASFENLTQNSDALINKHGPLIKHELFWNIRLVLVYDGDDIDRVVKNASIIRPPFEIVKMYRESRKDRYYTVGIVNTQHDEWYKLRSILFTSMQIPNYIIKCIPNCNNIADDFINILKTYKNGKIDNFDELIVRFTAETSFLNILGKRMGLLDIDQPNQLDVFISSQMEYFQALHTSFYGFPWWKYLPSYIFNTAWTNITKFEESTYDTFLNIVENEKKIGPKGLLKLILESNDIHDLDKPVLAMDLAMGAIEPVLNSIIFCLHFISTHPEVEKKLYHELKNILYKKDTPIDENTLIQLPYLKSCVQESFRLIPTTPNLARLLEKDIQLQGYNIPAYTVLICQHWHSSIQDKYFYKAKEYIPERWLCSNIDDDNQPTIRTKEFLPHRGKLYHFGFGKRDCPGRRFSFMEICIFLAKVLRNYEIKFDGPITTKFSFLQGPELPINARLKYRLD